MFTIETSTLTFFHLQRGVSISIVNMSNVSLNINGIFGYRADTDIDLHIDTNIIDVNMGLEVGVSKGYGDLLPLAVMEPTTV